MAKRLKRPSEKPPFGAYAKTLWLSFLLGGVLGGITVFLSLLVSDAEGGLPPDPFGLLLLFMAFGWLYGVIPATATAVAATMAGWRRNITGMVLFVCTGTALSALFGLFAGGNMTASFSLAGAVAAAVLSCSLPKAENTHIRQG
ncbi:hypothetical protein [Neisseria sp.]|uniref:hypothetical protein n=1 Tax=Neisseria sp. TaxID=192066 RepID=UPI00359F3E11